MTALRRAIELVRLQGYDPFKNQDVVVELAALLRLPKAERPTEGATRDQKAAIVILELTDLDRQIAEFGVIEVHSPRDIDIRSVIRESRAYEATTGPPRSGTNEPAPGEGLLPRGRNSCSPSDFSPETHGDLTRIAEISKPDFSGAENCGRNPGAETAMRNLEQGDVADETSTKTRH